MGLNKSQGNMFDFISHTWNTVKGTCSHDCEYCYMKGIARRFNKQQCPAYFDEKELINLGKDRFIFVGSGNDLFAKDIPAEWIIRTLDHCLKYDNKYLFQTKNPARFHDFKHKILAQNIVATTMETNRYYLKQMGKAPSPYFRHIGMQGLQNTMITIEPIMDFDIEEFINMIYSIKPKQVNIGADSGNNHLPEPTAEKVIELIAALETFTIVKQKSNLNRIFKV